MDECATWRFIRASIAGASKSDSEGSVYHPSMEVTVSDQNTSYKEALCKHALQSVYGKACAVKRVRPQWLKSPHSRYSLELDAYCQVREVAVEYNGKQHYTFKCLEDMHDRVEKDLSKLKQTRKMGVHLIVIP